MRRRATWRGVEGEEGEEREENQTGRDDSDERKEKLYPREKEATPMEERRFVHDDGFSILASRVMPNETKP